MATTGKKKQKSKQQTMSLQSFLATNNENIQAGYSIVTAKRTDIDWAAEVEKEDENDHLDMTYSSRDNHQQYVLPSAPMGPNIDMDKVPNAPPFTAFIGGLSYDVEQEDIRDFFKKQNVLSIRIPRSTAGETERFRGFGYVEFQDRDSLIEALGMNETFFKSGRVKIDIAENQNDQSRRRGDKSDRNDRDRSDPNRSEHMVGNWRSAPRDEPVRPPERSYRDDQDGPRERDRFGGDRDRDRGDRYGSRGFDRGQSERDSGGGGGGFRESRDRGYGNFSRGAPDRSYPGDRERQRDDSDRGYDRGSRGGGRREYGSGFERRSDDRRDFGSSRNASSYDRPERSNDNVDNEGDAERDGPRERPKLIIKPRTKPLEEAGTPVATSAIFGGAKPVDTAAKEREIEQRLAKERELSSSRPLGDGRARESERDLHKEDGRKDYGHEHSEDNQRRTSTGSQPGSRHSSTSVPPPSSVRSSDGGASGQSETDEEKEKPAAVVAKPPSPRREDSKAVPAPPPKENAWAKRSTAQPRPTSAGERSRSSDNENENRHSNVAYAQQRSSSVSSTGSDEKPRYGSPTDSRPPPSRRDDSGYGRKGDDNVFRASGENRERSDQGSSRGMSRGGAHGGGRGYGERRSGPDGYSRNDDNSNAGQYDERPQNNERQREMPKFVEPEIPSYASSNMFTQLTAEEYDE